MQYASKHKITKLNLDKDRKYLDPDETFYGLNHETNNPLLLDKGIPLAANFPACEMELPQGENFNDGRYFSPLTNELYYFTYNTNGVNFISRINSDGVCEVVYNGECLLLSSDPAHEVVNFRMHMQVEKTCKNRHGKQLIWVDGTENPIGQIDVEASIATNFFTTPFFQKCPDECAPIQMCVPEPSGCLQGEFMPFDFADIDKANRMLDKGFKFMYRYVYYDLRASEWSDRSTLYFQDTKGCFDSAEGFPRCMKFRIPIGNPLVDKIEFGFSEDGGNTWFLSDTIEKYKKYTTDQQYWYERDLSELVAKTYSESDCSFDYIFCNDRQRTPIDPLQVSREYNPMPRGAQGLIKIKNSLGFYNYIKGNCPLDQIEVDKFKITADCDTAQESLSCNIEFSKVVARAIIYNKSLAKNGFIFRVDGDDGEADDVTKPAWFSTVITYTAGPGSYGVVDAYGQKFTDKTRNFIAYIEGTNYWGEMKQFRATKNFTNVGDPVGVLAGLDSSIIANRRRINILNGDFYYQEYTFTVPKGTKGFIRLASHHETSGAGSSQDTSTQVIGKINLVDYSGTTTLTLDEHATELYFDTCDGDVDDKQALVVGDLMGTNVDGNAASTAYSGYITDLNNQPVEGARIVIDTSTVVATTDHNGFYSFYLFAGVTSSFIIKVFAEVDCGAFAQVGSFTTQSDFQETANVNYKIPSELYRSGFYSNVYVQVDDCDGNGVNGIRVAMSGSKYKLTDNYGIARFKLRNYATRDRTVRAVLMDKGGCFPVNCALQCNACMPSSEMTVLDACFNPIPTTEITLSSRINTSASLLTKLGLKSGGRYPFGIVAEGDCGRLSAVYHVGYIDIPRTQEKGKQTFCKYSYNTGTINLPTWVKRIKIVRGANINPFTIQWIVDDIERTTDSKIKLTIQSLNDYNAKYNFKTNSVYKYSVGDRVEFIKNGDGKIFLSGINGVLNYLTLSPFNDEVLSGVKSTDDVNFFNQLLIADDGKLDNLVKGALIEIQTPPIAQNEPTYFEICASIPVNDGQVTLLDRTGTFTTFDTFLVSRQIAQFPAQLFESKNPSDFWGIDTGLSDVGKPHFVNPYENEKRYGRNITINSPTQFNYFGDFEKTFGGGQEDIVALVLNDDRIGAGITVSNNFLFQVSDELLRVGSDNVIRATTADNFISNPEAKLRGTYGCSYEDIGSIFFGDGFFTYIDSRSNAYVVHNYQLAKEAGESLSSKGIIESSCSSFFRKRIIAKENTNKSVTDDIDRIRYSTGFNKNTGIVFLTTRSWRHGGTNNAKAVFELPNDTIVYNPLNDTFLPFVSFTPEGFSQLNLNNETGCAFVSFYGSIPYIHPIVANRWNNFYGIACDWLIGATINQFPSKIKVPVAIEVQSDTMFFASKVTTEEGDFTSEIPPIKWKQNGRKWNAEFLNNSNSKGGLYNGENARSYSVSVLFCRDNTQALVYNSIDDGKREKFSQLDEILFKFMVSEQSGFDQNL